MVCQAPVHFSNFILCHNSLPSVCSPQQLPHIWRPLQGFFFAQVTCFLALSSTVSAQLFESSLTTPSHFPTSPDFIIMVCFHPSTYILNNPIHFLITCLLLASLSPDCNLQDKLCLFQSQAHPLPEMVSSAFGKELLMK